MAALKILGGEACSFWGMTQNSKLGVKINQLTRDSRLKTWLKLRVTIIAFENLDQAALEITESVGLAQVEEEVEEVQVIMKIRICRSSSKNPKLWRKFDWSDINLLEIPAENVKDEVKRSESSSSSN